MVILTGSFLLMLPQATRGEELSYLDALFTATSAVCVTGLVVVDTGTFYTPFGQAVIMALIFIGSVGFMTMATAIFIFLGRRISLRDRLIVKEALNRESLTGVAALVKSVVGMALIFNLAGAALLSLRFVPEMGLAKGIFHALFHAVSAFGNAGFDLFGNFQSLSGRPADYLVNGTIMVLFIMGGLGFTVILELARYLRCPGRLSLHSKMVVVISALLLFLGTLMILALERGNPETLGGLSPAGKIFAALFTAATPRTAGFNVVDTASLGQPAMVLLMALMFIGASPASTGGGVKTTTFGVVLVAFWAMVRGRQEPVIFLRRIAFDQVFKAVAVIWAAAFLVFTATFLLTIFEEKPLIDLLFETFSAFGTVGLSTGITPELSDASKLVLIVTMLCGRLGPLTMFFALTQRRQDELLHYPEEKLMIG